MEKRKRATLGILKKIGIFFAAMFGLACLVFVFFAKDLPRPEKFTEKQSFESTKIYDRTGQVLLYEIYGEEKRTIVPLPDISENLQKAVIATEDSNFYNHFGLDVKRLAVSLLTDLLIGKRAYGGSTIPQQLIRSTFLSTEKTATRKIREIILSIELDRRYSKDQILEWFLNQVPFGQNAYGAEAAAQTYFKKSASELSLAQAATLTALINGPSYYNPYSSHLDELLERKDFVLDQMVKNNFITEEEAQAAKEEEIVFAKILQPIKAPHFTLWVKDYLEEKYGQDFLIENGLKVYTSIDWNMQEKAEELVEHWAEINKNYGANNEALVAIDPKTGEILSMIGSANWYATSSFPEGCTAAKNDCLFDPKVNIAIGTKGNPGRQPGSSFKPFVYVTAFENGFSDTTTVPDIETNFGVWGGKEYVPQDYDGKFRGEVTLRSALAQSLNIPAVRTLYLAGSDEVSEALLATDTYKGYENIFLSGLENSLNTAEKMGITTLNRPISYYGPALVLGGGEVKLLEMVSAYGIFATEGLKVPPVSVLKIVDNQGKTIEENKKTPQRVLSVAPTQLINSILSDNEARAPMFGLHSSLYFENYQVAVKTGTTQDYRDAWVIGYTPSIVVGVWAGNNNNAPINKRSGSMIAAPLWHEFMENILPMYPNQNFTPIEELNP